MKFDYLDKAASGRHVIRLRVGALELDILRGLVNRLDEAMPKLKEDEGRIKDCLRSMRRTLNQPEVLAVIAVGDKQRESDQDYEVRLANEIRAQYQARGVRLPSR